MGGYGRTGYGAPSNRDAMPSRLSWWPLSFVVFGLKATVRVANAERPSIAAGPFLSLSSERLDLEIHTTHASTRRHAASAGAGVLLRHFGHHGFGGDRQRGNGGRVLDGYIEVNNS